MFFSPIFFASVGVKTDLRGLTPSLLIFGLLLLLIAILTKVVGCGLGAKLCKFSTHDSLSIGVGMVSRGEVALIVAQKGAFLRTGLRVHVRTGHPRRHRHDADHTDSAQAGHERQKIRQTGGTGLIATTKQHRSRSDLHRGSVFLSI